MRGEVVFLHCGSPSIMVVRSWNCFISNLTTLLFRAARFLLLLCISNLYPSCSYINGSGATKFQAVATGTNLLEMETISSFKSQVEVDEDRLSDLPEDVIHLILSILPIKDAVATTTLSTNWRYKWRNIAQLVFDDNSIPLDEEAKDDKLVKSITNLLRYHTGPLKSFILRQKRFPPPVPAVSHWINTYLCTASSLTNLEICITSGGPYNIPSNLFNCRNLVRLLLWNCAIEEFPSTFTEFKVLKTLWLINIVKSSSGRGVVIDNMISSCPLLDILFLRNIEGISCLNICAPRLRCIFLDSKVEHVSFGPNRLAEVYLRLSKGNYQAQVLSHQSNNSSYSLCKLFDSIKNSAKFFWCTDYLLRNMSIIGPVPERLPGGPFIHLKGLIMEDIKSRRGVLAFLCILRSCPNLKYLTILQLTGGGYWEDDDISSINTSCPLPQLKCLNVFFYSGSKREMDLIQFLLSNTTTSLQTLSAFARTKVVCSEFFKERIMQYGRASPQAQVSVSEIPQLRKINLRFGKDGSISWT